MKYLALPLLAFALCLPTSPVPAQSCGPMGCGPSGYSSPYGSGYGFRGWYTPSQPTARVWADFGAYSGYTAAPSRVTYTSSQASSSTRYSVDPQGYVLAPNGDRVLRLGGVAIVAATAPPASPATKASTKAKPPSTTNPDLSAELAVLVAQVQALQKSIDQINSKLDQALPYAGEKDQALQEYIDRRVVLLAAIRANTLAQLKADTVAVR